MDTKYNLDLSQLTSFKTGGAAETFISVNDTTELLKFLHDFERPIWLIGNGNNILVSDDGLKGTTIQISDSKIDFTEDYEVIVGAGANWDELVELTISKNLWGIELMSGIPSSVGAAVVGNIAAYGQAVSDVLSWVEVVDYNSDIPKIERIKAQDLGLRYRHSCFNDPDNSKLIVRVAFKLNDSKTCELSYESAKSIASDNKFDLNSLQGRRDTILLAREKAGSLLDALHPQKTAGSFFKNPLVDKKTAETILKFEERDVTRQAILKQNKIHGGNSLRVSAAHVLLAAGYQRGQNWGPVRLHPDHILKIENTADATSQQIYDVATEIIEKVKSKLNIILEPEIRFMGKFH